MQQQQQADRPSAALLERDQKIEYFDSSSSFAVRCTYRDEYNPNPTLVTCTNSQLDFEGE